MKKYIVMCKVWGGVTGERVAPLKEKGAVKYFDVREDAEAEATALRRDRGYGPAQFHYWVEEVD